MRTHSLSLVFIFVLTSLLFDVASIAQSSSAPLIKSWSLDASERVVFEHGAAPVKTLYVSTTGSDQNSGGAEDPFATLEQARDEIRMMRQRGELGAGGLVIEIAGGRYSVSTTLSLGPEDSGTMDAPVTYRAAAGSECIFSGGVRLSGFAPVSDASVLERVPEESRGKLLYLSLESAGMRDLPPLVLGGSSGSALITQSLMELFWDGEALPMARYPNTNMMRVTDICEHDGHKIHGLEGSKIGRVIVDDERVMRWAGEKAGMLYGYWFFDWADSYERIGSINTETREISFMEPYHWYGYRKSARFFAVNMLCELDAPGEWYLDRTANVLYLYPPSDPENATIELSHFAGPMLAAENTSHLRFEGITWELSGGDAIHLKGGDGCLFAGCTVRRCGGNGITVDGGAGHAIVSCDIYSMGRGGTVITGGDRKTLTPGGHLVANCHIHHLSRINHTYTPAILVNGVGNRCVHNVMHHSDSSAMRVNGNDHLLAYNEVHNVLLESDDQGGADMWGDATFRGNVYRYNFWHHLGNWDGKGEQLGCGQAGIRLDDAISGTLIHGNVFYRCASGKTGFGGVQIHGGKDNIVENNIFADCAAAISFSPWGEDRWKNFVADAMASPDIDSVLYLTRYPDLAQLNENANTNIIRRNLVWKCGRFLLRDSNQVIQEENAFSEDDGLFPHVEANDFQLPETAASALPPGFMPIPFNAIGCYVDEFRKQVPEDK